MWKIVFGSVQGTSHLLSGVPCQDYSAGRSDGRTLVAACADGAGSAGLSHLGAKVTVDRFMEIAVAESRPSRQEIEGWVNSARDRLLEEAFAQGESPRQLACTFLAVLIGDGWCAFVQIGDGLIVFDSEEGYGFAFWPENGEYANTTSFLSQEDYREHLRIEIVEKNISELAIMTDGLQLLALDIVGGQVHAPFFSPLFKVVRSDQDEARLQAALLEFMDSKRVNDRTDDDKTLLLAARISTDVSQIISHATV